MKDSDGNTVARVEYNSELDRWNDSNFQSGGAGRHLGITHFRKEIDGMTFVLIHGTQWQGERDYAELVSDEEAKEAALKSGAKLQEWIEDATSKKLA